MRYWQTWMYMPRGGRLRSVLQAICYMVTRCSTNGRATCTGHEASKTEIGYGGGGYAHSNCRWCDRRLRVPLESLRFTRPEFFEKTKLVGKSVGG